MPKLVERASDTCLRAVVVLSFDTIVIASDK
jgi:hypothetical protein